MIVEGVKIVAGVVVVLIGIGFVVGVVANLMCLGVRLAGGPC